MNKLIPICILVIETILLCGCTCHFPEKVERYISRHDILDDKGNGELDLRKALDIDYDTMYVFCSFTPLNGVQNIIGIKDYGDSEDPYTALIASDSGMCRIIFIKNNSVVYEDDYYYYKYRLSLQFETFRKIKGNGIFDGQSISVYGYISTKHHFTVSRGSDDEYIMK